MTPDERRAVAALVAAAKKFIPPMSLPCTQDELDLQLGAQCVEQLPGFRATEEKRTLLSPEEWERQFDQVNDALLDGHHNPEGYMEWWLAHHPKPKNKPAP